jgi:hypothetical protein
MSDKIATALITGGFMLAVIVFNELFAWRRDERRRAKELFQNFFPERLNAHKEVLRVITESGVDEIDPKPGNVEETAKTLEITGKRLAAARSGNRLFMDDTVYSRLGNLWVNTRIAADCLIEPEGDMVRSIDRVMLLQDEYYKFIKLLREKSGVGIIEQEFAKAIKARKKIGKEKGAQTDRGKRN